MLAHLIAFAGSWEDQCCCKTASQARQYGFLLVASHSDGRSYRCSVCFETQLESRQNCVWSAKTWGHVSFRTTASLSSTKATHCIHCRLVGLPSLDQHAAMFRRMLPPASTLAHRLAVKHMPLIAACVLAEKAHVHLWGAPLLIRPTPGQRCEGTTGDQWLWVGLRIYQQLGTKQTQTMHVLLKKKTCVPIHPRKVHMRFDALAHSAENPPRQHPFCPSVQHPDGLRQFRYIGGLFLPTSCALAHQAQGQKTCSHGLSQCWQTQ